MKSFVVVAVVVCLLTSCKEPPVTADPVWVARLRAEVIESHALVPSAVDPLLVEAEKLRHLDVPEAAVGAAAVAILQTAKGEAAAAEPAAREALGREPDSATYRLVLARVLVARKSFDAALAEYRAILAAHPDHVVANDELARLLFDRGRFQEALGPLERIARSSLPEREAVAAWRRLGLARSATGDYAGAADAFQRALYIDRADKESHLGLAELFLATKRPDLALQEFTSAGQLGAEPAATCGLARAIDRLGDPGKAAPLYEGCANSDPARFDAWRAAAEAWEKSGDKARALARYGAFVELASRDPSRKDDVAAVVKHVGEISGPPPPDPAAAPAPAPKK